MHLSIVHKERIEIKEEQIICKSEPNLGFEKELLMCDICDLNFETQIILDSNLESQGSHLNSTISIPRFGSFSKELSSFFISTLSL